MALQAQFATSDGNIVCRECSLGTCVPLPIFQGRRSVGGDGFVIIMDENAFLRHEETWRNCLFIVFKIRNLTTVFSQLRYLQPAAPGQQVTMARMASETGLGRTIHV